MAVISSAQLNEEPCPIPEQVFGQIRQAAPPDAVEIAKGLPEPQRARLALFLYNRSHLHDLGMIIALSCDREALIRAGGQRGEMIYDQSRRAEGILSSELRSRRFGDSKPPITLAGPKFD